MSWLHDSNPPVKTHGEAVDALMTAVMTLYRIDTGGILCTYCNSIKFIISPTHNKIILFASDNTLIIFH